MRVKLLVHREYWKVAVVFGTCLGPPEVSCLRSRYTVPRMLLAFMAFQILREIESGISK